MKNLSDIQNVFKKHEIEAVEHVDVSFEEYMELDTPYDTEKDIMFFKNPQKYFSNNVDGTVNLLKSMIENGVKRIVFSSTAATYGEPIYTPIDENHPQKPINPYGETKLEIEKIMDEYDKSFNLKSVRLRYFNVAGADNRARIGEWHEPETHLIPNILKSTFGCGKTFQMFGTDYDTIDGTCVRDYINVEDLAKAHVLALDYSVCEKVTGGKIPVDIQPRREGDPAILVADNQKAKKVLGWVPEKTLEDSILSAYNWEKKLSK